jgi:hypothetical protein
MARVDRRAVGGRKISGVEVVLDADRHAEQRESIATGRRERVQCTGPPEQHVGVDPGPGVPRVLADRLQEPARHLRAGELAAPQAVAQRDRAGTAEQPVAAPGEHHRGSVSRSSGSSASGSSKMVPR